MKTMYQTPIALAVAALFVSPLAFANDHGHDRDKEGATLVKKVKVEKDVEFKGTVNVGGDIDVDSNAMAVVDDEQKNFGNYGKNRLLINSATVGDDAMESATGNIGVNVAAGDNNQQANAAALAATDAGFVFGSADAEIFAAQMAAGNTTKNYGVTNLATLSGNALQNASGNIGVNIAAGNSNQQKNDLAASVSVSAMADASVAVKQMAAGNTTKNKPDEFTQHVYTEGNASISLTGTYTGAAYQQTNFYSDIWGNDPGDNPSAPHPTDNPGPISHADFDIGSQGAVENPDRPGVGGLAFDEAGDITLGGTASWSTHTWYTVWTPTTNTASLSGNVLRNASGNIGVNIAAGTNNQQYNGLAIAAAQAPRNGNGGE